MQTYPKHIDPSDDDEDLSDRYDCAKGYYGFLYLNDREYPERIYNERKRESANLRKARHHIQKQLKKDRELEQILKNQLRNQKRNDQRIIQRNVAALLKIFMAN